MLLVSSFKFRNYFIIVDAINIVVTETSWRYFMTVLIARSLRYFWTTFEKDDEYTFAQLYLGYNILFISSLSILSFYWIWMDCYCL